MDSQPFAAPLANPLYYLENFRTVLGWVGSHHADLLTGAEHSALARFAALSHPAQALLVRLVMRRGTLFRVRKLRYPEIGAPLDAALDALAADGWVDPRPELALEALFTLLTRPELAQALAWTGLKRGMTKRAMFVALCDSDWSPAPLRDWWPESDERVVALTGRPLFDLVRLLFFGNLHQDWSEFVLTELGHQRYESVPFSAESRAFQSRAEVDTYLHLHACRERLESGEAPQTVWSDIPHATAPNPWLESRRARLIHALGCLAERRGEPELAQRAWDGSTHREARLRRLRLLERRGEHALALSEVETALAAPRCGAELEGLERLRARLVRRLDPAAPTPRRPSALPGFELRLPPTGLAVEDAVAEYLTRSDAPVFYVENRLLNGLFALLCWPALYAPLPGAFFHPFHACPADLEREDFVARRRHLFDACLATLDTGEYRTRILSNRAAKHGVTSPFTHWPTLSAELVELAVACIPARHLGALFRRMLADLREHRSGLPDLIQFLPQLSRYRLIEVKAPGDRLQDHQRRWLRYCREHGIDVAVCRVRWDSPP